MPSRFSFIASIIAGLVLGQTTDPSTWPACASDAPTVCNDGYYLNPVACKCFTIIRCSDECEAGLSALIPTESCTCKPYSDIQALYPAWASGEIAAASEAYGLTQSTENQSWR